MNFRFLLLPFIFLLGCITAPAQNRTNVDSLKPQNEKYFFTVISNHDSDAVYFNPTWKYQKGDNPNWADYNFNDSDWNAINVKLDLDSLPKNAFEGICWFRTTIVIDSSLKNTSLGLIISHLGASEIYIDGKLVNSFGKVGLTKNDEQGFDSGGIPIGVVFDNKDYHVIAIRYSNQHYLDNYQHYEKNNAGIAISLEELNASITRKTNTNNTLIFLFIFLFGLLFALSFVHLLLFFFYKRHQSNLYYSLFTLIFSLLFLFPAIAVMSQSPAIIMFVDYYVDTLIPLLFYTLVMFLYSLFYHPFPKIFWVLSGLTFLTLLFIFFINGIADILIFGQAIFVVVEAIRIIIRALKNKYRGSKILGTGVLFFTTLISVVLLLIFVKQGDFTFNLSGPFGFVVAFLALLALLSVPISMSVYLAKEFSMINKDLTDEKEKLELRVIDRTKEVVKQKETIQEKNKEIVDSITYAKRIQEAFLPTTKLIQEFLPNSFILYQPKDIVSGDFYWLESNNEHVLFAAVDCTGHGVPGALVSIVGHNGLNRAVKEFGLTTPSLILDKLTELIEETFEKSENNLKDGMDIALCCLNKKTNQLQFAGANNPLYLVSDGELTEIKGDKQPIGSFTDRNPFTNHTLDLKKGDTIYIFSDGFADQFGGPKGKKYKYKQFRDLIVAIIDKSMPEQKSILENELSSWKGSLEQIDDICIIGVRI